MVISHKHKFLFVSVPKTATKSITDYLNNFADIKGDSNDKQSPYNYHATAMQLLTEFKKQNWNWEEYIKFTVVRNPWDKLVSNYFFKKSEMKKWKPLIEENMENPEKHKWLHTWDIPKLYNDWIPYFKENTSFQKSVLNLNKKEVYKYDEVYGYSHWIGSSNKVTILNHFIKMENIQSDFNTICDRIGISRQELPHKNASKHKHYTEYYDEETKQIVAEKYAKDIEYFGYKFGE